MRLILCMILMAGCAWGQVTVQTNRLGAMTKNSLIVTGATFNASQVTGIPHETNATAHASLFGQTVKTNQTITVGETTLPLVGDLTFPGGSGVSAPTVTNIAQAVTAAHSNRTDNPHSVTALQAGAVATNDATYLDTVSKASTAWQNPASVNDYEYYVDSFGIVLTRYKGAGGDVVIPDIIDGIQVNGIGDSAFRTNQTITSVTGNYITDILPSAFQSSSNLTRAVFPKLTTLATRAFNSCASLTAVYYSGDQPSIGSLVFGGITANQVTNFVTSSTATGWGATFGGMPVVRMPIESEHVNAGTVISITSTTAGTNSVGALTLGGVTRSTWPSEGVNEETVTNIVASITTNRPTFAQTTNIAQYVSSIATQGLVTASITNGLLTSSATNGVAFLAQDNYFTGYNSFANASSNRSVFIYGGGVASTNPTLTVQSRYNFDSPYSQVIQDWRRADNTAVAKVSVLGAFTGYSTTMTYNYVSTATATTPSFCYSDGKSGMYFPTATSLGLTVVNTNRVTISTTDITATLPVTAPNHIWSTVRWVDATATDSSLAPGGSAPQRTEVTAGSGIHGWGYAIGENSDFSSQAPHGLAHTNAAFPNLYFGPHLHVSVAAVTAPNTNATFVIKLQAGAPGNTYDGFIVLTQTVSFAESATNSHAIVSFGVVTNNTLQAKDSVVFRGNRMRIASPSGYDVTARVIVDSTDIHVPVNELGSLNINGD